MTAAHSPSALQQRRGFTDIPPISLEELSNVLSPKDDKMICSVCQAALHQTPFLIVKGYHRKIYCSKQCHKKNADETLAFAADLFKKMALKKQAYTWLKVRQTKATPKEPVTK